MIDSLKLTDETATAIVALAIEFQTYTDDMPETKKDRLEAAHESVTFAIDAWIKEKIRSDSDDKDTAKAGEQVEAVLEVAGVEVDESGTIGYGKPLTGKKLAKLLSEFDMEIEGADEDEGDDDDDDSEAAFEIGDIIDGYEELTPASKIKAIKKLDLDPDDEDDAAKLEAIADWEEEQDKPASRVMSYLEELLGTEEGDDDDDDDAEAEGDEDEDEEGEEEPWTEAELKKLDKEELREAAEQFEVEFPKRLTEAGTKRTIAAILEAQADEDESEGDDDAPEEEPWEDYDKQSATQIKKALKAAVEDDDEPLTEAELQYTIDYEKSNDNRSSLLKHFTDLMEEKFGDDDDEPAAKTRTRKRGKSADPDDSDDVDNAVEGDDDDDDRKSRRKKKTAGDFDPDDDAIEEMLPKGLARTFVQSQLKSAEKEVEAVGLTAPADYDGDMPELPDDIDGVDHSQLSNLLLDFQNALSTCVWQQSFHYIWQNTFGEIAEYMEAISLLEAEGANEGARKAEAKTDERVVFFRSRHAEHYNSYVRFRDLAKTIEGKVKAVSRVGGFKDDEAESEALAPAKRSVRGKARGTGRRTRK